MGYTKSIWKKRIAERTDLSSQVVHLTREADGKKINDVLISILSQRTLIGSTSEKGFICGNRKAVCFQDAPLSGICQNVFFEQKSREKSGSDKVRYRASGIAFNKDYVFQLGARPVIYDKKAEAKKYLPTDQHWRIVNFDLDDDENFIDWTHEREWRSPGDFKFDLSEATLLFVNESGYKDFIKRCKKSNVDYLGEVKGIVVMNNILY